MKIRLGHVCPWKIDVSRKPLIAIRFLPLFSPFSPALIRRMQIPQKSMNFACIFCVPYQSVITIFVDLSRRNLKTSSESRTRGKRRKICANVQVAKSKSKTRSRTGDMDLAHGLFRLSVKVRMRWNENIIDQNFSEHGETKQKYLWSKCSSG